VHLTGRIEAFSWCRLFSSARGIIFIIKCWSLSVEALLNSLIGIQGWGAYLKSISTSPLNSLSKSFCPSLVRCM
jgi:hypothetical protein